MQTQSTRAEAKTQLRLAGQNHKVARLKQDLALCPINQKDSTDPYPQPRGSADLAFGE